MRLIDYDQIQNIERRIDHFLKEIFHDEWIDSSKACEILGKPDSYLYYHTSKGNIGFTVLGSLKYYLKREIENFRKFRNSN